MSKDRFTINTDKEISDAYKDAAKILGITHSDLLQKVVEILEYIKSLYEYRNRNPYIAGNIDNLIDFANVFFIHLNSLCVGMEKLQEFKTSEYTQFNNEKEEIISRLTQGVNHLKEINLSLTNSNKDNTTTIDNLNLRIKDLAEANQTLSLCNNDYRSNNESLRIINKDLEEKLEGSHQIIIEKDNIIKIQANKIQNISDEFERMKIYHYKEVNDLKKQLDKIKKSKVKNANNSSVCGLPDHELTKNENINVKVTENNLGNGKLTDSESKKIENCQIDILDFEPIKINE